MSIVGPREISGFPNQELVQDFNQQGNELVNQRNYEGAIIEYNKALGEGFYANLVLIPVINPADPLILWNRSAAFVLLGDYRTLHQEWSNNRCLS